MIPHTPALGGWWSGEETMKVGLATIAFRSYDLTVALDAAQECGCEGVELWGKPPHTPKPYNKDSMKKIREEMEKRGLKASIFGSYVNPINPDFREEAQTAIEIAQDLGTSLIRVWAGNKNAKDAPEELWRTCIDGYKWYCKVAADAGITLAVEIHANSLADVPEGMLRLIEETGAQNLKANYQLAHVEQPEDMLPGIQALGPHIVNVHAQNFRVIRTPEGLKAERTNLIYGDVDYRDVVVLLKKLGFDGFIEVEFIKDEDKGLEFMVESLRDDIDYLRNLIVG